MVYNRLVVTLARQNRNLLFQMNDIQQLIPGTGSDSTIQLLHTRNRQILLEQWVLTLDDRKKLLHIILQTCLVSYILELFLNLIQFFLCSCLLFSNLFDLLNLPLRFQRLCNEDTRVDLTFRRAFVQNLLEILVPLQAIQTVL